MYRASVIIPVYNAEKTLERCVESLLYGRERNLEVLLIDDCSQDGSWALCQTLAEKYDHVRAFHNETNRGVSYTRNRGLDAATGEYILFVDSDDWVSGEYAAILLDEAEKDIDSIPVCGYHFLDHTRGVRQDYVWDQGAEEVTVVERRDLFGLLDKTLLQQLWTKAFRRKVIAAGNIRFDERMSMGEDFQFVLDYIEASGIGRFRMVNRALYYYIRYGNGSLMSQFGLTEFAQIERRYARVFRISGNRAEKPYEDSICSIKQNIVYHIMRAKQLSKAEKLARIEEIQNNGNAAHIYRHHKIIIFKERVADILHGCKMFPKRVADRIYHYLSKTKADKMRSLVGDTPISIISQNGIGGVLYHDLGWRFLSPTINLYMTAPDFVRFVSNLEYYLDCELQIRWNETYPVGKLDDITIYFMHYKTCREAQGAWNRRKTRVNFNKLLVVSTDRDGFGDKEFELWKKIPYSKVLFTVKPEYAAEANSVCFQRYAAQGFVPDLIPKREFYKNGILMNLVNQLGGKQDGSACSN